VLIIHHGSQAMLRVTDNGHRFLCTVTVSSPSILTPSKFSHSVNYSTGMFEPKSIMINRLTGCNACAGTGGYRTLPLFSCQPRTGRAMKTIIGYTLARAIFLGILASTVLAQPSPPSQGIQIGNSDLGAWDIRFSSTVTQCEPVPIYYNSHA